MLVLQLWLLLSRCHPLSPTKTFHAGNLPTVEVSENQSLHAMAGTLTTLIKMVRCATTNAGTATVVTALCAGKSALQISVMMEPTAANLTPTVAVLATQAEISAIITLMTMA